MAKPSGIKATHFIDECARWFKGATGQDIAISYMYDTLGVFKPWKLYIFGLGFPETPGPFTSFTALRRWMEAEVRRQKILFRRF